mmetsp:Transcript_92705/g.247878  ORF Transcript_92705/g.247878 Transcript_92705/m.247878 type:complete len:735 (-) Transcript_92705:40-2244(-)
MCLVFHVMIQGDCVYAYSILLAGFGVCAILFLAAVVVRILFRLCWSQNREVLEYAFAHRRRSKVHDYTLPGNPFFDYDQTNVRRQNLSGVVFILYFRFIAFGGLVFGTLVPALGLARYLDFLVDQQDLATAKKGAMVVLYALVLLLTCRWWWSQIQAAKEDVEDEPHHSDFAVVAQGFPRNAKSCQEIKDFFDSVLGFDVEGVSIAYDFADEQDFVEDRISRIVQKADTYLGVYPARLGGVESRFGDSQDAFIVDGLCNSGYVFVIFSREEDRAFCIRRFEDISRQIARGEASDSSSEDEALIIRSLDQRGAPARSIFFRGKYQIHVGVPPEPCGIRWENFRVQHALRWWNLLMVMCLSFGLVFVVAVSFLGPGVLFQMSFINLQHPKTTEEVLFFMEQASVCWSVAISNRVIAALVRSAALRVGFLQRASEDAATFCVAATCMLFNCVSHMLVVAVVSYQEGTVLTVDLTVEILFHTLVAHVVVTEIERMLLPLLLYWHTFASIADKSFLPVREAEVMLTAPEMELWIRYADHFIMWCLACGMLAFKPLASYTMVAILLCSVYCVATYLTDKYRFLRTCGQVYSIAPKLDSAAHYFFTIPPALIFVGAVFRVVSQEATLTLAVTAFCAHVALSIVLVRVFLFCSQPEPQTTDVPYVEVASMTPFNYFNTNKIHVLRALHFPSLAVPPIYPCVPGKEYLHGGQFADFDEPTRLREGLMRLVKAPLQGWPRNPAE